MELGRPVARHRVLRPHETSRPRDAVDDRAADEDRATEGDRPRQPAAEADAPSRDARPASR